MSQGRFLGQRVLDRPGWSQAQATVDMSFTEPRDGRPCCPSSPTLGPSSSGVPAHLLGKPGEEVPSTQEIQNKIKLALGLEGWGEGKDNGGTSWALPRCPKLPWPARWGVGNAQEDSSPKARAKAGR